MAISILFPHKTDLVIYFFFLLILLLSKFQNFLKQRLSHTFQTIDKSLNRRLHAEMINFVDKMFNDDKKKNVYIHI